MRKLFLSLLFTVTTFILVAQNGGRPVIGISSTWGEGTATSVPLTYVESVIRAGGVPMVIPLTHDEKLLAEMLDRVDGVIMTGGEDLDPLKWYGEEPLPQMGKVSPERDSFDMLLIKLAVGRDMPLLGICRGHQLLNVAFGGTLYQDIPSQVKHAKYKVKHRQQAPRHHGTHTITIEEGSLLAKQLGAKVAVPNSYHHQAVKDVAPGFKATAFAADGVIEAIEKIGSSHIYGVQFHPEGFTSYGIDTFLGIFKHLVEESKKYHNEKR